MNSSYCVKCKIITPNANAKIIQTKNNKTRISSKCAKCGINKSQFTKSKN